VTIVLVLGMVLGQGAYGNNAGEKAEVLRLIIEEVKSE